MCSRGRLWKLLAWRGWFREICNAAGPGLPPLRLASCAGSCWAGDGRLPGLGWRSPAGQRRPALEETLLGGLGGSIAAFAARAWDSGQGALSLQDGKGGAAAGEDLL
ncbi:hypothetical protein NDU88_005348 [Pleurodeles waltl]|uniref:Uncharacterized protein n=1 Tax=Pleurodeles waltl TaxID=8319 RepID=A0AAV7QGZ2_PLEWA|nr:hypothetical protein NDU88_005348 [Pleurodeles waltl]